TRTRALNAGIGRTLGKKSPTYRRSASSSRSSAPPRSPSAWRIRAIATPPPIPVLRQPGVLAQLLAAPQLLGGGGHVVALAVDLAHPHVHVCRSAQNRPALLGRTLQGLLVGAHGLAETALRAPDVRQRDRAPEG